MRRVLFGVLFCSLVWVGCGSDSEPTPPNQPPTVAFVQRPANDAVVGETVVIRWSGADSDGTIASFEYSLDSETDFTATTDSTVTLNFTREDGTDSNPMPHVFRVRATDDDGLVGATQEASFFVGIFNAPPAIMFGTRPDTKGYIGDSATIGWLGEDSDGTVDHYEFILDDTTGTWMTTTDTTVTIDFSSGVPDFGGIQLGDRTKPTTFLNMPEEYTFYLRAQDNDQKYSITIQTIFLAGPENVPPTLTLLTSPDDPPAVLDASGTWTWSAVDNDGAIQRVQYAVDLVTEADWIRWDSDELTLNFTREDGREEAPTQHTFWLRAEDDDDAFSPTIMKDFLVGIPNTAPVLDSLNAPDPTSTVGYNYTYTWTARDDDGFGQVSYEYAIDDSTLGWTTVNEARVTIPFACPDVLQTSCGPAGCNANGEHMFFLRAVDGLGLRSATSVTSIKTFTRTPFTVISSPTGTDGEVEGSTSLNVTFTTTDVDAFGNDVSNQYLVREVSDFADFPDAQAAVTEEGLLWSVDTNVNATERTFNLESGKLYIIAVRGVDVALATESFFQYGRNVLKVTVP
ncbi:MAG: hypothetical protein HKN21_04015 [Candidatus Eisenbacteria bacterium]|uniref:Uncharacterized protein n=1 Tax=Eiseniibacteriota bacterium TaxID=2212470 RepID=A0A7Y2H1Q6_UNCEI|nr:hypothetical protein [Candidatus Eisenbacteria bacterium]